MRLSVRKRKGAVLSGYRVDTLRIFRGQLTEDLDFCPDHPVSFGVCVTDGAAGALVVTDPAM